MPVKTTIQVRRDTAANWTSTNPTLAAGEWGEETDTLKVKIGNGSTAWTSLAYAAVGTSDNLAGGAARSIPYQSATGATTFLAAGTAGYVLQTQGTGTNPTWVNPTTLVSSAAAKLNGGSAMAVVYQSAADTTAFLAAGTSGSVLVTNGTGSIPSWNLQSSLSVGNSVDSQKVQGTRIFTSATQPAPSGGLVVGDVWIQV